MLGGKFKKFFALSTTNMSAHGKADKKRRASKPKRKVLVASKPKVEEELPEDFSASLEYDDDEFDNQEERPAKKKYACIGWFIW